MSLFCYALLCVHSSFAIILKRKRKLVDLLLLSYRCFVYIMFCGSSSQWVGLQCVILVFPDNTPLLLDKNRLPQNKSYLYKKFTLQPTIHFEYIMIC